MAVQSAGGGLVVHGTLVTMIDNVVAGNSASFGGGLDIEYSDAVLQGNTFRANSATSAGGGVYVHNSTAKFETSFVVSNRAQHGGGLALETAAQIKETLVLSNTAERGGGIGFFEGINPWKPYATLVSTVIASNQASVEGAGVFIPSGGAVHMLQVTRAGNSGGDGSGVTLGWYDWQPPGASTVGMTNTILASQDVGIRVSDASTPTVSGVLYQSTPLTVSQSPSATVVVQHQLAGDPAFLDPDGGDYHIGAASAARNAGVDSGVSTDIDGQARPAGLGYDLGADEYLEGQYKIYLPPVLRG